MQISFFRSLQNNAMQIYFFRSLTGSEGMEKGGLARRPPLWFAEMIS